MELAKSMMLALENNPSNANHGCKRISLKLCLEDLGAFSFGGGHKRAESTCRVVKLKFAGTQFL